MPQPPSQSPGSRRGVEPGGPVTPRWEAGCILTVTRLTGSTQPGDSLRVGAHEQREAPRVPSSGPPGRAHRPGAGCRSLSSRSNARLRPQVPETSRHRAAGLSPLNGEKRCLITLPFSLGLLGNLVTNKTYFKNEWPNVPAPQTTEQDTGAGASRQPFEEVTGTGQLLLI